MDNDGVATPPKPKASFWSHNTRKSGSCGSAGHSMKQRLQPSISNAAAATSLALVNFVGSASSGTPPAKRFQKIRNPFEASWAEKLHLPVIASPSLFQRPVTPQFSSTQFEWTIDQVSLLQPAQVEPHETQFHNSPNPEFETKAQLAISSYFKEQQIVPSPVDCPLRSQRIKFSEIDANTPISKPGRRIRDSEAQTELTLPPVLPKELEEALRPYFKKHLAGVGYELSNANSANQRPSIDAANNSMRRKLFDMHNIKVLESDESAKTELTNSFVGSSPRAPRAQQTTIAGKLSDSLDKSSFGSLSPISNLCSLSPCSPFGSTTKRKTRKPNFIDERVLSPIPSVHTASQSCYRNSANITEHATLSDLTAAVEANENFTPDRSSSPMHVLEFSTDSSINQRVSRLRMNSSQRASVGGVLGSQPIVEQELFPAVYDDTQEVLDIDEDDMQVSQLSTQSFNCSSSNSDTPRNKRRSANRKNLSQSFSTNWPTDDTDDEFETSEQNALLKPSKICVTKAMNKENETDNIADVFTNINAVASDASQNLGPHNKLGADHRLIFYRTDSGFNETDGLSSSTFALSQEQSIAAATAELQSIGMASCSTPSRCPVSATIS